MITCACMHTYIERNQFDLFDQISTTSLPGVLVCHTFPPPAATCKTPLSTTCLPQKPATCDMIYEVYTHEYTRGRGAAAAVVAVIICAASLQHTPPIITAPNTQHKAAAYITADFDPACRVH